MTLSAFWDNVTSGASGVASSVGNFSTTGADGNFSLGATIGSVGNIGKSISDFFNKDRSRSTDVSGFDVNKFRASLASTEAFFEASRTVARPSQFEVIIRPPLWLSALHPKSTEMLAMRVEDVQLPGRILEFRELKTYGPKRNIVTGSQFQSITMTVMTTDSFMERDFFYGWIDSTNMGFTKSNSPNGANSAVHDGDVGYYDDYVGGVEIHCFSPDGGRPRLKLFLHEAYPVAISEVPMSWAARDGYVRHTIEFKFYTLTEHYFSQAALEDNSVLGTIRNFRNTVRNMVTEIRNARNEYRMVRTNLRDANRKLRDMIRGAKGPLGKAEALSSIPDLIAGSISDSNFKLLDRSNDSSVISIAERTMNRSISFFN